MLNQQDLKKFLKEAKINTYAKSGEKGEKIFKDGDKSFEYKKKNLYYRDTYFGFDPFIGEEIIFYQQKPIWGMNYYGKTISKPISAKNIYLFLKEALKKTTTNQPFRGPSNFDYGNFKYVNNVDGKIEKFIGEEKIYYKKELVYVLNYHGGLVMDKISFKQM